MKNIKRAWSEMVDEIGWLTTPMMLAGGAGVLLSFAVPAWELSGFVGMCLSFGAAFIDLVVFTAALIPLSAFENRIERRRADELLQKVQAYPDPFRIDVNRDTRLVGRVSGKTYDAGYAAGYADGSRDGHRLGHGEARNADKSVN